MFRGTSCLAAKPNDFCAAEESGIANPLNADRIRRGSYLADLAAAMVRVENLTTPAPDLFAIANQNAVALAEAFELFLARLPEAHATIVGDFARWVESNASVSINVKLYVAVELLNGGSYQNVYEWAQDQCVLSGRPLDEILREQLGAFHEQRLLFDQAYRDGERFRYGAMNAGGLSVALFAPYCLVLNRSFVSSLTDLAYLPGDSLRICLRSDGVFDPTMVDRSVTPHDHRGSLVAMHRVSDVVVGSPDSWARAVISPDHYFEAVFVGDISIAAVQCIRVPHTEYQRLWDLAFSNFTRKHDDATRALIHDFVQLRRAVVNGQITLEVIE